MSNLKPLKQYGRSIVFGSLTLLFFVITVGTIRSQEGEIDNFAFLPAVASDSSLSTVPTRTPTPTVTPIPTLPSLTATPMALQSESNVDFPSAIATVEASGKGFSFNKIGFHTGPQGGGANRTGINDWMVAQDAAGVPFFLKTVDDAGPIFEAQEIMKASGVPHTLVFRHSIGRGASFELPDYNLSPEESAEIHWERHKLAFPPELDPALVWIETINEPDKNRSEWLATFSLETAKMAIADGFNYAALSWSAGEPEPEHWESPEMLAFLEFAGQNKDRVAIAIHEYSFTSDEIVRGYPFMVGRFQAIFEVADKYGFERPTILITEWGWEYQHVPTVDVALEHIAWANLLYATYPEIKGAAIWYLGPNFGPVADETQLLIAPMTDYALQNYFAIDTQKSKIDTTLFQPSPTPAPSE